MRLHFIATIAIICVCGCERAERASLAAGVTTQEAPAQASARTWRGLDLSNAPVSSDVSRLAEIWEQRPSGSRSYELRADVTVIQPETIGDATVYWVKAKNRFYVQDDPLGSSTRHYYGPFDGDPQQTLGLSDSTE